MDFSSKIEKLRNRRIPYDHIYESFFFDSASSRDSEAYSHLNESQAIKYAIGSMQPIDLEYTENTFKEGERVKNQLSDKLPNKGITPEFRYQGSVTSDTHIKSHSDIDLLVLHTGFYTLEPPLKPEYPYSGNPVEDLIELRNQCTSILKVNFPAVTIDESGSKSIALSGGSLKRKIDVVPSNWYETESYSRTGLEHHRGVMILDVKTKTRPKNFPFLHNKKIDDRDTLVNKNLRKCIRLMKSVKYDSDKEIGVSSYDITALAYCMPDYQLDTPSWYELKLVDSCVSHLAKIIVDEIYRESLLVPDESRKIFGSPGASIENVSVLYLELNELKKQIENDLGVTTRSINKAEIYY